MEDVQDTVNSADDLPASGLWGRWWVRLLLFVAHLALLVASISLAPDAYAYQLGATVGPVIVFGTLLLWFLVWFARTRPLVLLFCSLILVQAGITSLVSLHFRSEARLSREVAKEVAKEVAQRRQQIVKSIAGLHLERVFEMLTPGNQFHPEELPQLLDGARSAKIKIHEMQASWQAWLKEEEQRIAAEDMQEAASFRKGVEDQNEHIERDQKRLDDYVDEIEKLIAHLIDRQGHYRFRGGLVFDTARDADTYNQIRDSLTKMGEQLRHEGAVDQEKFDEASGLTKK
jgi:multisubunit Na+/H+ antiporter MnhG subunit